MTTSGQGAHRHWQKLLTRAMATVLLLSWFGLTPSQAQVTASPSAPVHPVVAEQLPNGLLISWEAPATSPVAISDYQVRFRADFDAALSIP